MLLSFWLNDQADTSEVNLTRKISVHVTLINRLLAEINRGYHERNTFRAKIRIPARPLWQPRRSNNREQTLMVGFDSYLVYISMLQYRLDIIFPPPQRVFCDHIHFMKQQGWSDKIS